MNVHQTIDIAVPLTEAKSLPLFVPVVELQPGSLVLESQCTLHWDGVPEALEMRPVVAPLGTELGAPVENLAEGAPFTTTTGMLPLGLHAGLPDLRPHQGVLGVTILEGPGQPTTLAAGAKLVGRVSLVYGAV
jgi:hypothetical protein